MTFQMQVGDRLDQRAAARRPRRPAIQAPGHQFRARLVPRARRHDRDLSRPTLRTRAWRITMFGDEIETITEFDPLTGQKTGDLKSVKIYANSHYVTPRPTLNQAIKSIKEELQPPPARAGKGRPPAGGAAAGAAHPLRPGNAGGDRLLRRHRELFALSHRPHARAIRRRPCSNTSPTTRWSSSTRATSPCRRSAACIAATSAARRRSPNTASACRPAWTTGRCASRNGTPCARSPSRSRRRRAAGRWKQAGGVFAEQVIRPTGLIDPPVEVRPAKTQVDDVLGEIRDTTRAGYRTLVTVLTKRMAEDLTEYLHEQGVRVRYMHSDIDTLERIEILRDLRLGAFDVPGRHQPAARRPRHSRMRLRRHPRRRQGRVPALRDLADPDHRPRRAQRRRQGHPLRRHRSPARWSGRWPRRRAAARSRWRGTRPTASRRKASSRASPTSSIRSTRRTTSAPTFPASPTSGAMVGNNLKAHLEHLEKQMRDAAADLDFETRRAAARRDQAAARDGTRHLRRSAGPRGRGAEPGLGPREGQAQQGPRAAPGGGRGRAQVALRQAIARRDGTRHRHGDAGRRRLALAVQEAVACRGARRRLRRSRTTAAGRCSARTRWTR